MKTCRKHGIGMVETAVAEGVPGTVCIACEREKLNKVISRPGVGMEGVR